MTPRRDAAVAVATGLAGLLVATLAGPAAAATTTSDPDEVPVARFDAPHQGFAPASTRLQDTSAAAAGLDPAPVAAALAAVEAGTEPSQGPAGPVRPLTAGAVTVMAHDGAVVAREATGWAVRYADGAGTELPREQWVPAAEDTVYDMASVSKLFTSIVIMQQVEAGRVDLDAPVTTYLPAFASQGEAKHHGAAAAHAHRGPARVAAAAQRVPGPSLAHRRGAGCPAGLCPGGAVPVQRHRADHRGTRGRAGQRAGPGRAGRRGHHRASGHGRHRVQPDRQPAGPGRRHRVPGRPGARHGAR